jgi:5'-nucleotidase / UDP-sugar diphosphatase
MPQFRNLPTCCLLVAFLLAAGCAADGNRAADDPPRGLSLLHMNDTYRIGPVENGSAGGFGRVASVTRDLLAEGRDVRLTHAGDFLFPSLESQVWGGMQMVEALNFLDGLAPLYVTVGNHETDPRSAEFLVRAVGESQFDWLGDNVRFETGVPAVDDALHSQFTFEYAGHTVGVFALTLTGEDGGNERDYAPVTGDYMAAAERAIRALTAKGAGFIIGLTHLHLWEDEEVAALKARYPQFRLILGGHEHEPEYLAATGTRAAVMKGGSNARTIWRIDIGVGPDGELRVENQALLRLDENIASDPDYDIIEHKWRDRLLEKFPFLTARVGVATAPMDAREVTIRNRESAWGDFIVDQMRGAFGEPPADLAFLNSGTLRLDDYVAGDIHFEDIGRTFGFSSRLRYLRLTGREFRTVLEAGYRGFAPSQGYFPQVSGFRVCVDRGRPEGERIVSLQVPGDGGWQEIEPERSYAVVVPDYLYRGGDGYRFPDGRDASRPASELKYLVLDGIMRAQANGETVGTPVDPENPRIVVLASPGAACFP